MKKVFLTFIAVATMSMALYAGPTQEYLYTKYYFDQYELSVDKAKSCESLDKAKALFLSDLNAVSEIAFADDQKMTQEEQKALDEQLERIQNKVRELQKSWNCESGEKSAEQDVIEEESFVVVEEMPEFPGGMAKLTEYLAKNIKYPQAARENGIQGRVFVNFVVERDGSISNVKVMRSLGGGCDEEAVRVVKSMPKWEPGKQRGKAVRVSYNLPINFKP